MRIRSTILCSAAFGAVAFGCVPTAAAAQESDGVSEDAEATDDATIVVVGIRGSVEVANDMKRTSKQIVDSVVAEDVGKLPDNNVPEALSRVTGVQIDRARGPGQGVTIRGLSEIPTPAHGRSDARPVGKKW